MLTQQNIEVLELATHEKLLGFRMEKGKKQNKSVDMIQEIFFKNFKT